MTKKDLPDMRDPLYDTPKGPYDTKKPRPAVVPPAAVAEAPTSTAVDLPDMEMEPPTNREDPHKDQFESAVKMAFVGAGQGGGRIAQAFHDMGYRKVCAVNTTDQDLASLSMPFKRVIGNNRGGAGKDPEQGELAAKESFEDIMDLLMRAWGEGVEQMFVCVGAGGGSGTGSWPTLLEAMKEYAKSTNIEKPIPRHLGIIMTLPKRSEGARVQKNALLAVNRAVELVEKKQISSLILVDNAKIHDLFPGLAVKQFWQVANKNFAAVLHTFNLLAAENSEYNTFDRADFRSVLRNGLLIFGMTRVTRWEGKEDISQAVRQNLKNSLLADGFDLSKADMAGAIVVAHDEILSDIPMENIDYAFHSLGRTLGNEGITLHSGIYEGRQEGMRVFTIVSGLQPPKERLKELENLSA
jgi:cell division GTPase FtsZ